MRSTRLNRMAKLIMRSNSSKSNLRSALKVLFILGICLWILPNQFYAQNQYTIEKINEWVLDAQNKFAPDKRVAIFEIQAKQDSKGILTLSGKCSLSEARDYLVKSLRSKGLVLQDSIQILLPAKYALITISVANLRTKPAHSAELATQALLGTPLIVLESADGWYRVQTPDNYISWVDNGGIQLVDGNEFLKWKSAHKIIILSFNAFAYATDTITFSTISDLVAGNILVQIGETGKYFEVVFPDGRKGYVSKTDAMDFNQWMARPDPDANQLIVTAVKFLGIPYLWGGTSTKGVDCSGFIKMSWFLNGIIIQRDASQQALYGTLITTYKSSEFLRPGDLLFFGYHGLSGSADRVTHVAMVTGLNSYIHSSGYVKTANLSPALFESTSSKSFSLLKGSRYLGNIAGAGIVRVRDHPLYKIQ
jgi:gamma-D-glutamyl-L-lysine dipeptidyl-peptidase